MHLIVIIKKFSIVKKLIVYLALILFFSLEAQALIGNKKHQSSPNHIYVSNKDSKDANVRFNIAKRHCSKYKKNTFHFKNDWYKGNPLPTGFRKKNYRYICALNSSVARELLYDFIANKFPKKKYNKKIGKQKSIVLQFSSRDFETRTPEQIERDKAEKKRIEEEKRLAEIKAKEEAEKRRLAAIAEKKRKKIEAGITDNTTLVKIKKNIDKSNLFPEIDNLNEVKLISLNDIDTTNFKNIINKNKEVYFLTKADYLATSNIVNQIKKKSQMKVGETLVPNPDLSSLKTEINNLDRQRTIAYRKLEIADARVSYNIGVNCGADWICLANQAADIKVLTDAQKSVKSINSKLNKLIDKLANTPAEIARPRYKSYEYIEQDVEAKKEAIFKVIKYTNGNFQETEISFFETKKFRTSSGINAKDKNYEKLKNKYDGINKISNWQNIKFSSIDYLNLFKKINNQSKFQLVANQNKIVSMLKETKIAKINIENSTSDTSKSGKTSSDNRFDSVVVINTNEGMGAGFYVSSNLILTNYHVIENSLNITIENINGKKSSARLIKKDLSKDLALLKVNKRGKPVRFFNGKLNQGTEVEALGHPRGLKFSLSKGTVSAIRKYASTYDALGTPNVLFIQTDAAINPGNSGGPLFYKNKVVGVNTQGLSKSENEGLNFAVHYDEVKRFLK